MWPAFEKSLKRFQEIETLLADPAVIADGTRYAALLKEHGSLAKTVRPYQEYLQLSEYVAHAEELAKSETDPAMTAYAEEELKDLVEKKNKLQSRLEELLLVDPAEDFSSVIME